MPAGLEAFLVDNSAFHRSRKSVVADRLQPLLTRGLLYTCAAIELEAGQAVSGGDYERTMHLRWQALVAVTMPDQVWTRAAEIQRLLAQQSQNQAPGVVDLIVAVCAEHHGLTILHYDNDFDRITAVTQVRSEWVAAPGSADGPDDL